MFRRAYEFTRQVPKGKVTTYAAIAEALNRPRSARVVGFIMSVCPYSHKHVPCHRVIRSDGSVGGYGSEGMDKKIDLLKREGVAVKNGTVDLGQFLFTDFSAHYERSVLNTERCYVIPSRLRT